MGPAFELPVNYVRVWIVCHSGYRWSRQFEYSSMILRQRFFSNCRKRMQYANYQFSIRSPTHGVKVELL